MKSERKSSKIQPETERVHRHNDVDSGHYAEALLKIGDGFFDTDVESYILLSREFCNLVENDLSLITQDYPGLQQNLNYGQ
ncbi:hypothetical protein TNCV_3195261 [Trichonephila clavipes]|uniref:Uncharacterized protein n=1 Tax=Trichonephila clavipes TaxID=2585209 RepID=A0A8X6V0X2_TRICX|nr:hypothetical protein TNCV_3195261 [Trichonephila clavipes]